jgi:hypothetical protein
MCDLGSFESFGQVYIHLPVKHVLAQTIVLVVEGNTNTNKWKRCHLQLQSSSEVPYFRRIVTFEFVGIQCPCSHSSQTRRSCPANELDWRETLPRPCAALPLSNNGQRTTPLTKSVCREPSIRAPRSPKLRTRLQEFTGIGTLCYQGSCSVWGTAAHLRKVESLHRPCSS